MREVILTAVIAMVMQIQGSVLMAEERPKVQPAQASAPSQFDGRISRAVLERYLSRAITMRAVSHSAQREEDIRMLKNVGAKFIGRAACQWGNGGDDEHFRKCQETAELIHQADPDILLEACVFEAVNEGANNVSIPVWVFEEFRLKPQQRNFRYDAMLYDGGKFRNRWRPGWSVPDMSKLETRMWFFYHARRYIDAGYEALHLGQVHIMDQNDLGHKHWNDMLTHVRAYAAKHARRHLVLCNAHTHGIVENGKLLFDFHCWPVRVKEVVGSPQKGILEATTAYEYGKVDAIYGRSKGGQTPSGWKCEHLPYIVELDNWGSSSKGGQAIGPCWVWGYDDICWFARQPVAYRNEWLRYAWNWVREHDPNGWLEMPGQRRLADPVDGVDAYYANTKSEAAPQGYGQEETIKAIWAK